MAEVDDYLFLSEAQGVGMATILQRHSLERTFTEIAHRLRTELPESFAGAEFIPGGGSWVAFRSEVPSEAVALVGDRPIALIADRGFSELDLSETLAKVFSKIAVVPGIIEGWGSYDQVTGEISIDVLVEDRVAIEDVVAEWRADNPTVRLSLNFRSEPSPGGLEHHLRGGGHLNNAYKLCTWGFAVRHNTTGNLGWQRRITAAEHQA